MQQRGFTLIELIIVIVILGILAVTAAPKFIDIQSDATSSTLQGARAALQGGAQLVYAKSAIAGEQNNAAGAVAGSEVDIGGVSVETHRGYPDADSQDQAMLNAWVDLPTANWTFVAPVGAAATAAGPADGSFGVHPVGSTVDYTVTAADGDSCHVLYNNSAGNGVAPVVNVVSGGC
ncbi:prepilin-type N-terminal cleavage/methylation domain-containing protein [Bowmanella dokdonensis]|uniref:Prepilin-type N-terminal cleavage/methylation domain-containing protein n=1 Tax=Bowmanella dokdonensis TaxID=751969 RepID=A0A939IN73_9ALTE|nr:prepilin-type N-terminal cleavage/methylation domain-containing protein [Bowmanella dokdonensis]MBN7826063.1 prepilin-type N-terminal cleavage/methylation domain-containing protein [Bowmanella dokdonensis]